jgi:hypothetical protein
LALFESAESTKTNESVGIGEDLAVNPAINAPTAADDAVNLVSNCSCTASTEGYNVSFTVSKLIALLSSFSGT